MLNLEVGKYYRTVSGQKVSVVGTVNPGESGYDKGFRYRVVDLPPIDLDFYVTKHMLVTEKGRRNLSRSDGFDITELWVENPTWVNKNEVSIGSEIGLVNGREVEGTLFNKWEISHSFEIPENLKILGLQDLIPSTCADGALYLLSLQDHTFFDSNRTYSASAFYYYANACFLAIINVPERYR